MAFPYGVRPVCRKILQAFLHPCLCQRRQRVGRLREPSYFNRRIYIGLHEKEAHADTLPKAVYLHVDALRGLTNSLNQAIIEVARHIEGSDRSFTPFGGDAISLAALEQSVRAALAHDS